MNTKGPAVISPHEMERQKEYISKLGALTEQFRKQHGHPPLALLNTYGCQQNENDSEKLAGILQQAGYGFTKQAEDADLVLFNTCAVRENAELKVFGNVGALVHQKRRNPEMLIALCGCMMQQPQVVEAIKRKYRHVDMVFGPHTLYRFGEILYHAWTEHQRIFDVMDIDGQIAEDVPVRRESGVSAWVSTMYGCNNFCTYCIVPYVRGRERSRQPQRILDEVRELADSGVKDITLLGQNVNSYGKDLGLEMDFPELLRQVNAIPGDFRIRFMTSHPKDATEKLFAAMAECEKVVHHLHLPVQSGSDRVLAAMNRHYTSGDYLQKIEAVRRLQPDIVLSSDIIVGFPGETEQEFEETLKLIEQVEFDTLFTFLYSKREGTPAAKMECQIPETEKHTRFNRLLEAHNAISLRHNRALVGKTLRVLAEGPSKNDAAMLAGRTDGNRVVNFKGGGNCTGRFVKVKITEANTWSLNGEQVDTAETGC